MSGTEYSRPVIKLDFTAELGSGPDDPVWVVIRNPKLLPPKMLRASRETQAAAEAVRAAKEAGLPPPGEDVADVAMGGTHEMAGKLVVGWRVPDPSWVPEIDLLTGEISGDGARPVLPPPSGGNGVSADQFASLPMTIQLRVLQEITDAVNPQQGQEDQSPAPTSQTSSGSPSPSTTEPGAEGR